MDSFSFTIPQNIKFGAGTLDLLPDLAKELGKKQRIYYFRSSSEQDRNGGKVPEGIKKCRPWKAECFTETEGNPSTDTVVKATEGFKKSKMRISLLHLAVALRLMLLRQWLYLQRMVATLLIMKVQVRLWGRLFP